MYHRVLNEVNMSHAFHTNEHISKNNSGVEFFINLQEVFPVY